MEPEARAQSRDGHSWVIQGAATEWALVPSLPISTSGLRKTHSATAFCGLLLPPSKLHEILRLLYPPLIFTRNVSLGVFSWDHLKLGRLTYFYTCWDWEGSFISTLVRGIVEKGHGTHLQHVSCHGDNGRDGIVWSAGWKGVQPGGT